MCSLHLWPSLEVQGERKPWVGEHWSSLNLEVEHSLESGQWGQPQGTTRVERASAAWKQRDGTALQSLGHGEPVARWPQGGKCGSIWAKSLTNFKCQLQAPCCLMLVKAVNITQRWNGRLPVFYFRYFPQELTDTEQESVNSATAHRTNYLCACLALLAEPLEPILLPRLVVAQCQLSSTADGPPGDIPY